jgi:hypothetical protein
VQFPPAVHDEARHAFKFRPRGPMWTNSDRAVSRVRGNAGGSPVKLADKIEALFLRLNLRGRDRRVPAETGHRGPPPQDVREDLQDSTMSQFVEVV